MENTATVVVAELQKRQAKLKDLEAQVEAERQEIERFKKELLEALGVDVAAPAHLFDGQTKLDSKLLQSRVLAFLRQAPEAFRTSEDIWIGIGKPGSRLAFAGRGGPMASLHKQQLITSRMVNGVHRYKLKNPKEDV